MLFACYVTLCYVMLCYAMLCDCKLTLQRNKIRCQGQLAASPTRGTVIASLMGLGRDTESGGGEGTCLPLCFCNTCQQQEKLLAVAKERARIYFWPLSILLLCLSQNKKKNIETLWYKYV